MLFLFAHLPAFFVCLTCVHIRLYIHARTHTMYAHDNRYSIEFAPPAGRCLSAPLYEAYVIEFIVRPSASSLFIHHLGCPGSVSSAGAISLKSEAKSFQRTWLGLGTSA